MIFQPGQSIEVLLAAVERSERAEYEDVEWLSWFGTGS
jgi:hypothetical protein